MVILKGKEILVNCCCFLFSLFFQIDLLKIKFLVSLPTTESNPRCQYFPDPQPRIILRGHIANFIVDHFKYHFFLLNMGQALLRAYSFHALLCSGKLRKIHVFWTSKVIPRNSDFSAGETSIKAGDTVLVLYIHRVY